MRYTQNTTGLNRIYIYIYREREREGGREREGERESFDRKARLKNHQKYLYIGGTMILRWILEKWDGLLWNGFIWPRMIVILIF
jgi:hypothetical protein